MLHKVPHPEVLWRSQSLEGRTTIMRRAQSQTEISSIPFLVIFGTVQPSLG